jgi:ureidoglycolate hydrolase
MTGDALVVVAPAEVDFSRPEHFDAVKAFVLPQYSCVHLHRGTWHWGPYPIGASDVRVFNIQARGWPTDNSVVELARDHGVVFEVAP